MADLHAEALRWPFLDDAHRAMAAALRAWAVRELDGVHGDGMDLPPLPRGDDGHRGAVDAASREIVRRLGSAGWLRHAVPPLSVRTLCLVRETLARVDGLADVAFAMQALGSGPISLFGTDAQRARWLPRVARGEAIAAFAISEADAGSDVAAMTTSAARDGDDWVINGEKTWISNAGIADQYVVFCRAAGAERAFVALIVTPDDAGFSVSARIDTLAPHPLGTIRLERCRVPGDRLIGEAGKGLRVALGTLDVFRTTVGAAALGFARRALDEAVAHASSRRLFGGALADLQLTRARLAEMATDVDASALLVYRAAWTKDMGAERVTREAAMAKLHATEAAQRVIDGAVQLLGGRGVVAGHPVERLYREIRALRIYEGTSEVQKLVIAQQVLDAFAREEEHDG